MSAIIQAFKDVDLRKKIIFTVLMVILYRVGAQIPSPGVDYASISGRLRELTQEQGSVYSLINLFSGGALLQLSIFAIGIMPYITASIIVQLLTVVIPHFEELKKEGQSGQAKMTQYTRYLTIGLALLNAIAYLFYFKSFGVTFSQMGIPEALENVIVVFTMLVGAVIIMWLGEVITQRGVGNGMSLIIFANIMSGLPSALISSVTTNGNALLTIITLIVIVAVVPLIVYVERGQRRIPVQYAKRVVGRRVMGGQNTYLPIKVNTAGVVPIIFASAVLYFPAQIAVFFPGVDWIQAVANALSSGWLNWVLSVVLIVFFAYFYTSMVFNPEETADQLRKQGGFIPGVRPGAATASYIKSTIDHVTLPGAIFMAVLAVVPTIIFWFTNDTLIQSFGGTSVLIMVGVAMDTIASLESQLKMHNYEGFFK